MVSFSKRIKDIVGDALGASVLEQNLEKALMEIKGSAEPKSQFYDPISMFMGRDWSTKSNAHLTPLELRRMSKNPIIAAIIQTRINQVAAFCVPKTDNYDVGYEIKSDEKEATDLSLSKEIESWIYYAGVQGAGEDLFETFARKFMRDSLTLDQACAEVVFRRNQLPAYFTAVDAGTIYRLQDSYEGDLRWTDAKYAQVIQDNIVATYNESEMIFGIRNPSTDIADAGYGLPELEMLMRTITTILNAEQYNSGQLTQGGTAKGVLVVKGDIDADQFTAFKRDFRSAIRNASKHWEPPVLKISKEGDVDWKTLDRANRDMEYTALFDFLVKQSCAVYQMDPSEINWSASGANVNFESRSDLKTLSSKQRGLRPLLRFLSNQINSHLISSIDDRYRLVFPSVEADKALDAEIKEREVKHWKTVNEIRADLGMEPVPGGDIILNQLFSPAQDPAAIIRPTPAPDHSSKLKEGNLVGIEE